jgi:hypothetical protein
MTVSSSLANRITVSSIILILVLASIKGDFSVFMVLFSALMAFLVLYPDTYTRFLRRPLCYG